MDHEVGDKLSKNLKGMYSIHINRFKYRIAYEVKKGNPSNMVIIHAIAHRDRFYDELQKYLNISRDQ